MSLFQEKLAVDVQEAELFAQKSLSSFPPVLRWVLILMIVAIIPAYYTARTVSQNIWLARYQQGAIVGKASFANPQAPKISNVTVTTAGSGGFAAVVQISNQNLDLSLENVPYNFTFYNAQKQQIYQYQGNLFLLPNQTKYVTAPTFTPTEQITYSDFQIPAEKDLPWQKRLNTPIVNLETSIPQNFEQISPLAFVAQGDFVNNSPYTLAKVRLTFVLYDQNQKIIGISQRDEQTVAPFERRAYKQLWPNMTAPNLNHITVTADTDTLNSNNLSVPSIGSGSSSDLSHPK